MAGRQGRLVFRGRNGLNSAELSPPEVTDSEAINLTSLSWKVDPQQVFAGTALCRPRPLNQSQSSTSNSASGIRAG